MNKLKNPVFWIGIISVILLAADIDPESLTSWSLLLDNFKELVSNPYMLATVIVAIYSQFNDNSTKKLDIPFRKTK